MENILSVTNKMRIVQEFFQRATDYQTSIKKKKKHFIKDQQYNKHKYLKDKILTYQQAYDHEFLMKIF